MGKRIFEMPEPYEPEPGEEDEVETVDRSKCLTMTVTLVVNTDTYGSAETIASEIEESLSWMIFDHDAILEGKATWH